jgi:transcription-repair coupling factor (superfamily II helicase)
MAKRDILEKSLKGVLAEHAQDLLFRLESASERSVYNLSIPLLASLLIHSNENILIVEDTPEHAEMLWHDCGYLASACNRNLAQTVYLPPPSSVENMGERARIAATLASGGVRAVITSVEALMTGFNPDTAVEYTFRLAAGQSIERTRLEETLIEFGYRKVSVVMEKGEYAERGWLFDIFPSTGEQPVRIEFFGDEAEVIRTFDIETQRSIKKLKDVVIFPATEDIPDEPAGQVDMLTVRHGAIYINSAAIIDPSRIEYIGHRITRFSHFAFAGNGIDSGALPISGLGILPGEIRTDGGLAASLGMQDKKIIITLPSQAQIERLRDIITPSGVIAPVIAVKDIGSYEGLLCITLGRLSAGLNLPGLMILTGREIFGEQLAYRAIKRSKVSRLLLTMDDLKPGDFVVHRDHGIGKFIGLHRERSELYEGDIITLEYAGGDRLYLPFHGIERLSKFSGGEGNVPALDRLGSKRWQNTKRKVKKSVKDMAEKLLRIHAERKVAKACVFSEDTPMHAEFDGFFQYEETEDQARATQAIIKHMQSDKPMDMLLCGDVGYGKTEVAIKAAFRAVYDGRQVAVLVPTTLLAEQHFRTFRSRFAAFPVRIDYLSRFKGAREVRETTATLAKGEIDIIIGTHMLLGKNVLFQDLGLIIIDEEHRFGVAQKERLKEMRKGVDVITLTATPIPRTLHMALSGIREIETIETPPEERLAVRSVVSGKNDKVIKEAVERELKREGQIFYVHNRITDIEKVVSHLKKIAPSARIAYAHGQMPEHQLEKIMFAFLNRETDLLVSTAIISSGLDIPTANTIIMDRADTFGLSDLYQLRGRVGRGNVQAYAYFLVPGEDLMTGDAKKRLQAIQEMSYLGAGFRLALKDLEIRGAGNLLGGEQSGHIYKVGFDMYMEMLEKAVAELKGEEIREDFDPQIRLPVAAYIPDDYVQDIALRLSLYKRLTSLRSENEVNEFESEMADRFGKAPGEVKNLLYIIRIKLLAKKLFVSRISYADGHYSFTLVRTDDYALPEGFAERLLNALFSVQKRTPKAKTLRFLQDGFELRAADVSAEKALHAVESLMSELDIMLQGAGS